MPNFDILVDANQFSFPYMCRKLNSGNCRDIIQSLVVSNVSHEKLLLVAFVFFIERWLYAKSEFNIRGIMKYCQEKEL